MAPFWKYLSSSDCQKVGVENSEVIQHNLLDWDAGISDKFIFIPQRCWILDCQWSEGFKFILYNSMA